MKRFTTLGLFAALLVSSAAHAQQPPQPILPLGGARFDGWAGLSSTADGATLRVPGEAVFQYPQGPKGWYSIGFRGENDRTQDLRGTYGVQFEARVPEGRAVEFRATIATPSSDLRPTYLPKATAVCTVSGAAGWQRVTLPWTVFDFSQSQAAMLEFIQQVRLAAAFTDGRPGGDVGIKNVRVVRAAKVALDAAVRGRAAQPGATVTYDVTVGNCTDSPQDVTLGFEKHAWETMGATVEPARLTLAPGATAACVVSVRLPDDGVPPGGHERQDLLAVGNGDGAAAARLDFVTARDVARPSILHTAPEWDEVREKVKHYDWAKQQQDELVKAADAWRVPEASPPTAMSEGHRYVFPVPEFKNLSKASTAWQLTRTKAYAEKCALFLRRLADEKTGYPSTFAAVSQGEPQEGENWQIVAIAYDAILDAGVLGDADKRSIDRAFRCYMRTVETSLGVGNVGNWSTAANTAALFCALSLGDLAAADRYLWGPSGFADYVTKGVMDDGWWWECSTSYNFWVAAELTQSALACRPWGIDLIHAELPANFSRNTIVTPWGLNPPYGMSFEKWGPNHRNTRSIKQLWDAVPLAADYRGVAFGMNDGHEEQVGGSRLELGYYVFRDPMYAALIKQSPQRDLIYGVPELPAETPKPYLNSGYAENIGYALLRSQADHREPREQIQAVLKIGTQGGYHGHFDRVSLDNLTRYGRSFWNPESIWWGYANYMYKFYVQTSVAHNMVVVDQMQQEAVPSSQLLFHTGKMMQVAVQETNARWSDPPFLGMQYNGGDTVESQMRKNRQSIPLVTDRKYGQLGPYSDRVRQRRMAIVTDDYVVLADDLRSERPHTFDDLFQMKGFAGFEADGKRLVRHDGQFNPDPHGAAQFITDCDWYAAAAPAVGRFEFRYGPGADNAGTSAPHSEDGTLKIDVRSLWPPRQEIMLAMPPENHDAQQWVTYEVSGDGKTLAKGESGVWVLGAVDVDVPVDHVNELALAVATDGGKKKSLFWANARLVAADGKETPIAPPPAGENVQPTPEPGRDYYGGPIKVAGVACDGATATQPADPKRPAVIHVPLAGRNAVRFKATLGGDYPFGDEAQRRKVYCIRSRGAAARFLTVLEPYEEKPMVKSATATDADALRVELFDGRVQEIRLHHFDGDAGSDVSVDVTESRDGKALRTETTAHAR